MKTNFYKYSLKKDLVDRYNAIDCCLFETRTDTSAFLVLGIRIHQTGDDDIAQLSRLSQALIYFEAKVCFD